MSSAETATRYHHGNLRNTLVQAAGRVLAEKGAVGLSLREVARVAGVSHAAPYRHFRDKADLMRAVAQAGFEQLALAINAAAGGKPHNPEQKLIEACVAYVRLAVQAPEITQLMFGGSIDPAHDPGYPEAAAGAYEALLGIVEVGVAHGVFRQRAPRELALVAWTSMHGMAMLVASGLFAEKVGGAVALEGQVRSMARNVIYGIAK